jgi:hypothetical protein
MNDIIPKLNTVLLAIIAFGIIWLIHQQSKESTQRNYSGFSNQGTFIILNNNTGEARFLDIEDRSDGEIVPFPNKKK